MDVNQLFPVQIEGNWISGIIQGSVSTGTQTIVDFQTGDINPINVNIGAVQPVGTFTTTNIIQARAATGGDRGLCVDADAGGGAGAFMYSNAYDCAGSQSAAAKNASFFFRKGIVFPRRFSVDHTGNATMQYQLVGIASAGNLPLVIAEDIILPTLPGGTEDASRWTMFSLVLAGNPVIGKRSLEIDFGNLVVQEAADSNIAPIAVSLRQHQPQITVRGLAQNSWHTVLGNDPTTGILDGLSVAHADSFIELRRRRNTATDIKISFAGLAYMQQVFDASGKATGTSTLRIETEHDGTNTPLVWDVGHTIP